MHSGSSCAKPLAKSRNGSYTDERHLSGRNLAQDSAQLVEVHRFCKMEIEPGFLAALDIVGGVEAGQRYRFYRLSSLRLCNHVVTVAVRQSDVAQDDIEFF